MNIQYLVPLALLPMIFIWRISFSNFLLDEIRNYSFDQFQRLKPREYVPVPVHIIDIDDATLEKYGQWPWPRTLVSRLVERLNGYGAAVIAFDAVFAEKDRTSPGVSVMSWPSSPETDRIKKIAKTLPDNDRVLADEIKGKGVVLGFSLTGEFSNDKMPLLKAFYSFKGEEQKEYVVKFGGVTINLPELEKNSDGNGSFSFMESSDGVIRQVPFVFNKGDSYLPSLAAECLRVAQGAKGYMIKFSNASGEIGGKTGIVSIRVGDVEVPTDAFGRGWVYYTKNAPGRYISAKDVLDKNADTEMLDGAIAIIGTSAAGLKDLRVTPLNPLMAGVEVHTNFIEQALLGEFLLRPDYADGYELCYILIVSLILIFVLPRVGAAGKTILTFGAIITFPAICWICFAKLGFLLDPFTPFLAILLVAATSIVIGYRMTETEKKRVRTAFGHYMHPAMVEELAQHPEKLRLGGEMRNMTILFCDIRGFTTISEQYDSVGLTRVINRFLTPMTTVIMERKGCIDKYIGDCIMAFWNAPIDDPSHMINSCESALVMQEELARLNKVWEEASKKDGTKYLPINIGVGLNTDDCCVGNLGSDQRFNYSVLGDGVNLASRLEGQSKTYGVKIVIGPKTNDGAQGFATLELDLIKVKGKTRPVNIYTLLGRKEMLESREFKAQKEVHDGMIAAYRSADFSRAEELLAECRSAFAEAQGLHKLYELYEGRITAFKANPPEPGWDGTYTATSK